MLFGNRLLSGKHFVARQVDLRVLEQSLVAGKLPIGLIQSRLIRPRINLDQRVILVDHLAFFEVNLHQLTVDAALHGYRVDRRYGAQSGVVNRDVPSLRFCRDDGDNSTVSLFLFPPCFLVVVVEVWNAWILGHS